MKKIIVFIILSLVVFNIAAWINVYSLAKPKLLEIIFFDVGQGDSIFIETPQSQQILIDGGPASLILEKLSGEMDLYDRTIDLIILTHPEHDHMAGLIDVLKNYEVKNILWTGTQADSAEFKEWEKTIQKEGAVIHIAKSGNIINSGEAFLEVLFPFENLFGQKPENINDTSIVVKLVFGKNSFLFTGDIGEKIEKKIIEEDAGLDSDILKIGHHGSKYSSSEIFIEAVSPEAAVIQCGRDNLYGHPSSEVLEVLDKYGISILRTDFLGDIKIVSNGNDFQIVGTEKEIN